MQAGKKRKRGAQPGNFNSLKHGRRSVRKRTERRAAFLAADEERRTRSQEWARSVPAIDYGKICDEIAAGKSRHVGGLH